MINIKTKGLIFKEVIKGVSSLLPEMKLKFTDEGIKLALMAESNAVGVFFIINKINFHEYTHDNDVISFMTKDFLPLVKLLGEDEVLGLMTDEMNAKLYVDFIGKKESHFEIPLLTDTNATTPEKESLDIPFSVNLLRFDFKATLEKSVCIGSTAKDRTVLFYNKDNKFFILREEQSRKSKIEVSQTNSMEEIKSKYNAAFILKILECEFPSLTLRFKSNYPAMINMEVKDRAKVWFLIAPRVDND